MNDRSLFAPPPRRKRGLVLTLAGSLLFHGSLIGLAALWPTRPAPLPVGPTEVGFYDPQPPGESLTLPAVSPSEPEPVQPELKVAAPVEPPPQPEEPDNDEMSLSTPVPRPAARPVSHPAFPTSAVRPTRAQAGPPTVNGSTGRAAGTPSVGHPGGGSSLWNTPKPAYPAPFRLARVQGSGSVRVTTNEAGRVVSATIVQSTGNAQLDDHTCRAAKSNWSGPPNSTISVPITYRLQ